MAKEEEEEGGGGRRGTAGATVWLDGPAMALEEDMTTSGPSRRSVSPRTILRLTGAGLRVKLGSWQRLLE